MSNQAQGGAGSAILGLLMLVGVGSCVFGGSGKSDSQAAAPAKTNTVDAPFLVGNPGLQAAHDQSGTGDGFEVVIAMKTAGCSEAISATQIGHHRYEVICSGGSDGGRLRFTKFMVDTDTGFTMGIGGA